MAGPLSADAQQPTPPPLPRAPGGGEALKLPPGTVILLYDNAADALRRLPNGVLLTSEKYQELLEQLEQLKQQARPDKIELPSACKLSGQVEGDLVRLRARFEFKTERPRAVVALGCSRAFPIAGRDGDGRLPLLRPHDDGVVVQVETPGEHQITLDLVVPVTPRGSRLAERGFDLTLPRSAITVLEQFQLPTDVTEVRIGGRTWRTRKAADEASSWLDQVPLGPLERLEVSWRAPAATPRSGPAMLSARHRVVVRVSEAFVTSEVELNLEVARGMTNQWRIHLPLPPRAVLEVGRIQTPEDRPVEVVLPQKQDPYLTLRTPEPTTDPLTVTFQVRQPRSPGPLVVGPFPVADALPQRGTIEVRAPAELRLRYTARGELSQREPTEDQRREGTVAWFTFWGSRGGQEPLLSCEVEAVRGACEARVSHTLRLQDRPGSGPWTWQVTTRLEITPIRATVERLEVHLPAGYRYLREVGASPAALVEEVAVQPDGRAAVIKLAQAQFRPFSLTLPGLLQVPAGNEELHEASLDLPRPAAWDVARDVPMNRPEETGQSGFLDRGGQLSVSVPEGIELLPRSGQLSPLPSGSREYTWKTDRLPGVLELAWRVTQAEGTVTSVADIFLSDRQARVRHRLQVQGSRLPSGTVPLRVPDAVRGRLRVVHGGKLDPPATAAGHWQATLAAESRPAPGGAEPEPGLVLEYTVDLPSTTGVRFTVPLLRPEKRARGESRVRVWAEPGTRPVLAGGGWEECPLEVVPDRDALPDLVVRGPHATGLLLRIEPTVDLGAVIVADRTLLRASITDQGNVVYQARFLVSRLFARQIDLELPLPPAYLNLDIRLGGKRLPVRLANPEGDTRLVRFTVEPELFPGPVVLEVTWQVEADPAQPQSAWQAVLRPLVLQRSVQLGRTRWAVELPPGTLPLLVRGAAIEQEWGRLGWLLGPRPAVTAAALEQWLTGMATPVATEPSLICWQAGPGPLRLFFVSQPAWLLACSLAVLAVGLLLALVPLPRWATWSLGGGLAAGVLLTALLLPDLLPALAYGCQPGALVLLMVVGAQALLQHRYRRQVVLLPGFTRLKTGSSLVRLNSDERPREPSTIDEPSQRGSSVAPGPH